MRPADRAWLVLAAGVIAYDLLAPPGETLSEGVDRYLSRRPWLTKLLVLGVAKHLTNEVAPWADPVALGFGVLRALLPRRHVVVVVD